MSLDQPERNGRSVLEVTIKEITWVKITTSGYADRWLKHDTYWLARCHNESRTREFDARFDDHRDLIDFLIAVQGMDIEHALAAIQSAEKQVGISGYKTPRQGMTVFLQVEDERSIDAYLKLRDPSSYKSEYVSKLERQLAEHPLSEDIAALVAYQLAECDRRNIAAWGHPNGKAAAQEAA